MDKLVKILLYTLIFFFIESPLWIYNDVINYILYGVMIILDIIIIIKTPKKNIHFDRIDLLLLSLPLIYILHIIFGLNKNSLSYNFYYIIPEFILVITVLVLRRYLNKKHINTILDGLVYGSIFYFFVSLFATDNTLTLYLDSVISFLYLLKGKVSSLT